MFAENCQIPAPAECPRLIRLRMLKMLYKCKLYTVAELSQLAELIYYIKRREGG